MTRQPTPSNLKFSDIYQQEKEEISKRRAKQSYTPQDRDEPAFVGLALSGGGIRSATFCLGFLQELHRLKLLRIFDYLSTVSGGGYLGGWWSAWLSRSEESLRDIETEPFFNKDDIHHPESLLLKIIEAADPVSQELLEQLKVDKLDLSTLQRLNELGKHTELAKVLVYPLNRYIAKAHESLSPPKNDEAAEANARKALELEWQARVRLVETFPYELRNIFPPPEKIEAERASASLGKSDGSRCAWRDPIHHLRLFANYLTPRKGILSADTWRAISAITRNLTLTWLIMLPLLIGVMLLGQAYFLLNGETRHAFTAPHTPEVLTTALIQIMIPVGVLLVWLVLVGIAWLLCNRDNSSSQDSTVQTTCFLALVVLIVYALASVDSLQTWLMQLYDVRNYFFTSFRNIENAAIKFSVLQLRLVVGWAIFTVTSLLLLWFWKLTDRSFPVADADTLSRWKREVRRSRFSRAQAKLLVLTAMVAAVLLLSWFSCFLAQDHSPASFQSVEPWKIPFALVPILSAIAGSIFTALRATPVTNADKSIAREPTLISRVIFAATPPLVVAVLAVIAAWFSHSLLVYYMRSGYQNFWEIRGFLKLASILAIGLCLGLALYEMQNLRWSKILKFSVAPIAFVCVLMININWLGQAIFHYISGTPGRTLNLLLSLCLGAFITLLVFRRVIPRGKWKWRLFRRLDLVKKSGKGEKPQILRKFRAGTILAATVLSVTLATIGYAIGFVIFLSTTQPHYGSLLRAVVLTIVGVSGGLILFRLLVTRRKERDGSNVIELNLFSSESLGKRPEALWLTVSVCLIVPVVLINVAHYIRWFGEPHPKEPIIQTPLLFPVCLGLLFLTMIVLRSFVIQKRLADGKPLIGWSEGICKWLFVKIPPAGKNPKVAYQVMAFVGACLAPLIDIILRAVWPSEMDQLSISPFSWRLSLVALFVSLPLFGVSFFQMPVKAGLYEVFKSTPRKVLHSQKFLWVLASFCILWSFLAGLLLPSWLGHVSEITATVGFTTVLVPVASGCLLMAFFEFYWGQRDNRRSLNLIAFAFGALAFIFFIRVAGAGPEWHIVPGLLAVICVWVGALGWMVDPNAVSMHQFYKSRLVRAYTGASNVRRLLHGDKEITETVAGDDLPLRLLRNCDFGGPYHLINTTLNLVAGRDLATAQRAATSFVLSQKYCGSARTNYCSTEEYMNGQLSLGTAVAASGAAVSPNMGAKKPTAALAMLMTLLNVRLGYWAPTPNRDGWNSSQPRLWPFYLVREFLSQTNDLSDYCYLTDGGHFDNTGLYSLIERGCRYVVVVDCGADPKPSCFEDLGEAIRRCRIDFGTEIKLKLDPFIETGSGKGDNCYAAGEIVFSREHLRSLGIDNPDEKSRRGTIIYFKPAVTESVTPDVRQYSIENKNFPQQPTTNQWFGEAQFESYRQLGQLCARQAFDFKQVHEMGESPTVTLQEIDEVFESIATS